MLDIRLTGKAIRSIATFLLALLLSACGGSGPDATTAPGPTLVFTQTLSVAPWDEPVELGWAADHAENCIASGDWTGARSTTGSMVVGPFMLAGEFIFELTCSGPGGDITRALHVTTHEPLSISISGSPMYVAPGESSQLQWSAVGATSCTASGSWSGDQPTSGTTWFLVDAIAVYVFELTCSHGGPTRTATAWVVGSLPRVSITATPHDVTLHSRVSLTWNADHASACIASGDWSGTKSVSGTTDITIDTLGNHTYTLTCSNPGGETSRSASIEAVPFAVDLTAFPPAPRAGGNVTLTWTTNQPASCTAGGGWSGSLAESGSVTVAVGAAGPLSFTLDCVNPSNSGSNAVTVSVGSIPVLPQATSYQITTAHTGSIDFPGGVQFPPSASWSTTLSGKISYPVIADGLIFVTAVQADWYGTNVYALDQQTGNIVWGPIPLTPEYDHNWSAASYEDGILYVIDRSANITAFEAQTGVELWSMSLGDDVHAPATIRDGVLYVSSENPMSVSGNRTTAVDVINKKILWVRYHTAWGTGSPSVTSDGVYVSGLCQMYALALDDGALMWNIDNRCYGSGARTSPVYNGVVYGRGLDRDDWKGTMLAGASGAELGSFSSSLIPAFTNASLFSTHPDYLEPWGSHYVLRAVGLADGSTRWTFAGDNSFRSAPIVINGNVIIGGESGKVYAIDSDTGAEVWFGDAGAPILASPWEVSDSFPLTGLGAGEGWLVVPAGSQLTAWKVSN